MARITGKKQVDQVLHYLAGQIRSSSTLEDEEKYCAAWILVFTVFYRPQRPEYAKVLHAYRVADFRAQAVLPFEPSPAPPICHRPLPFGYHPQAKVDGRTGRQWIQSALKYLEWRAGCPWRKSHTERLAPDYLTNIVALNFLNQVDRTTDPLAGVPSLSGCVTDGQLYLSERSRLVKAERRKHKRKKPQAASPPKTFVHVA